MEKFLRFVLLYFIVSPITHAALIDNGSYTTDSDSGLDWLDVTSSLNLSYNQVNAQFGMGGNFEGWRYATLSDFSSLVNAASGSTYNESTLLDQFITSSVHIDEVDIIPLVNMLGITESAQCVYWDSCWTADNFPSGYTIDHYSYFTIGLLSLGEPWAASPTNPVAGVAAFGYQETRFDLSEVNFGGNWGDDSADNFIGSFLVRNSTPVPEPSIIALMAAGLVGIGFARRRRKVQT